MTENKVKLYLTPKKPDELAKIKKLYQYYQRYKWPLWAVTGVLIGISAYYRGIRPTAVNVVWVMLVYVLIGNIIPLVKWVTSAKSSRVKERRMVVLVAIAAGLVIVGLFVNGWFVQTEIGQQFQRFLYRTNDMTIPLGDMQDILPSTP